MLCCSALGQAFTANDLPFLAQGSTDWQTRVVANGGAMPSANTIAAMETFRLGMISAGLTSKMHSVCIFVPDSLIAALTPIFKHKGSDPWTNNNFVSGDLTINGLKGDGSTKFLQTGVTANEAHDSTTKNVGLAVLVTEASVVAADTDILIGYEDAVATRKLLLSAGGSGIAEFWDGDDFTDAIATNDWDRVGFVSGNATTNTSAANSWDFSLYVASPCESHKLLKTAIIDSNPSSATSNSIVVFAQGITNSTKLHSRRRLSAAAVTAGLSQTESSNLWVLLKACRESLGGGTGDPTHNWSTKVVAFGGDAPTTATRTALSNFLNGLDEDATLYRVVAANAFVPDNLTAARVPIIWQGGNIIWSNVAFGTTNLTVNGLTGDATAKYLQTGLTNNLIATRGFGTTSAGIALLMHANPDTAGNGLMAVQGTGLQQFSLFSFAGTGLFRCWSSGNVNQNFVSASVGTTTNGWLSGQRTAANAIALYKARSDTAHTVVTNATGSQTGSPFGTHAQYLFAVNNAGTASAFSAPTISFAAVTSGMTQTQSSNLYNRVSTFRAAVGGGNP